MGKVGNVNSCIGFSCNPEGVGFEFGEFFIKFLKSFKIVSCWYLIIIVRFWIDNICIWKSHSSWLLKIKHICNSIPPIIWLLKPILPIRHIIRPIFLCKPKERGTPRPSVQPQDDWVFCRVLLRNNKYIIYVFPFRNVQIAPKSVLELPHSRNGEDSVSFKHRQTVNKEKEDQH